MPQKNRRLVAQRPRFRYNSSIMENTKRTVTCGELSASDVGKTVILNGWVHRSRELGGLTFILLRDRYGITQVVVGDKSSDQVKKIAASLKSEYCVAVKGTVAARSEKDVNKDMATGAIEVEADDIEIFTTSEALPFAIDEVRQKDGTLVLPNEDLRLRYRYLDLRREPMKQNIILRSNVTFATREYLTKQGFLEIETPTFIKSTPEGARDYLVPSRVHPGKFYSLPQSPQLYKQLLMVSGFDKYFQIARCYRDEDARGDRQRLVAKAARSKSHAFLARKLGPAGFSAQHNRLAFRKTIPPQD